MRRILWLASWPLRMCLWPLVVVFWMAWAVGVRLERRADEARARRLGINLSPRHRSLRQTIPERPSLAKAKPRRDVVNAADGRSGVMLHDMDDAEADWLKASMRQWHEPWGRA